MSRGTSFDRDNLGFSASGKTVFETPRVSSLNRVVKQGTKISQLRYYGVVIFFPSEKSNRRKIRIKLRVEIYSTSSDYLNPLFLDFPLPTA